MAFYGNPASSGWSASHLVHVTCPWTLHMDKATLHQIQIHKLCAPSLARVLASVWEQCGKDPEKIAALRYDRFSGSYNYRPMRGGAALSMHAYGAAIDWDDADNAHHSQKHLFTAESPLIKAFLDEGWEWGGNWSGPSIDAMHVQAAHVR
jgi:D-alanyl-D-alanine carboxypeptidase